MATRRQLAAIMYTDIASFSYMLQHNPELAQKVRERHMKVLGEAHELHDGNLILQMGEATLSIFDSAAQAVECAYRLQVELGKEPEIPLRIGIHSGEIMYDEAGAYGEGISIAAKIQRLAPPRSIYISGKVYDDIKNHSWLTAMPIKDHMVEELPVAMGIYGITNRGLYVPRQQQHISTPLPEPATDYPEEDVRYLGKSKIIAGFLALFFGTVGVHRFYLGQKWKGILYFAATAVTIMMSIEADAPIVAIVWIVALIDAILFFVMPRLEFDEKYNYATFVDGRMKMKKTGRKRRRRKRRRKKSEEQVAPSSFALMKSALRQYESRNISAAVQLFDSLLVEEPDNPVAHYYLACCFSLQKDAQSAFLHLDKALSYGFDDLDRIRRDKALKYFRTQPQFHTIKAHHFDLTPSLPPRSSIEKNVDILELSPLERLELLGNRLESGELSRSDFEQEKKKILGGF